LRSICYVEGLNYFMGNERVPFKGFKAFVEKRGGAHLRFKVRGISSPANTKAADLGKTGPRYLARHESCHGTLRLPQSLPLPAGCDRRADSPDQC